MILASLLMTAGQAPASPTDAPARPYGDRLQAAYEQVLRGELEPARAALDATELGARGFEWSHAHLALELALVHDAAPGLQVLGRGRPPSTAPRIEPVSRIFGSAGVLRVLALSSNGEHLAAGGDESSIHLWSTRTGAPERLLAGHAGAITGLCFARDGRRLLSASQDGNVILWDLQDGSVQRTFRASGEAFTALAWDASNEWIAAADATLAVRVWNTKSSEPRYATRDHQKPVSGLTFSSDGQLLASTSEDGSTRVYDVRTGDPRRIFGGDGQPCREVAFEPGASALLVTTLNGTVRRFDLQLGRRTGSSNPSSDMSWCGSPSPDGSRVAMGSQAGFVRLFDRSLQPVLALQVSTQPIRALLFDARASRLYATGDERVVFVIETEIERARMLQRENPSELPDDETAAGMRPLDVEASCRRVVERAGLAPETYARAEELARSVSARIFDSGQVLTTIGGALYRLERHEEALAQLTDAGERRRGWPPNLAFRAMALARLGRIEEARTMLARLETLLREERWAADVEARALLEETRSVVSAASAQPK